MSARIAWWSAVVAILFLLPGACPAADSPVLNPPFSPLAPQGQGGQSGAAGGLPALKVSTQDKRAKTNLCPVCGKTRTECYDTYERAKKDPSLRDKVCAVYRGEIANPKTRPWNCPVCGLRVNMPIEGQRYEDADTDLCPHPVGKVRFTAEITICPRSGFSAFQSDFRTPQSPEMVAWVKANLTPGMEATLRTVLGTQAKITAEDLYKLYEDQWNIPDTLRCQNAYAYYRKRYQDKDPAVRAGGLARVSWLTAWAFRREVSAPLQSAPLLEPIRQVSDAIQRANPDTTDLEAMIRTITDLYNEKDRFDVLQRQILRFMQAGYYNRLGLNFWAESVLRQIKAEVEKKYPEAAMDPWLKAKAVNAVPETKRLEFADNARDMLAQECKRRLECMGKEKEFLGYASLLTIEALKTNQYPVDELPSYIYLVGEFERRQENLSRAYLWLEAARQLLDEPVRVQHLAPGQIDLLKRYVADQKVAPPAAPQAKEDWVFLQELAKKVKEHRERQKKAQPAAPETPPAAGAATAPTGK